MSSAGRLDKITTDHGKKLPLVGEPRYHRRGEDNLAMICHTCHP